MFNITKRETNIIKCMAIVMVIIGHYQWWIKDIIPSFKAFTSCGVTIFLFLSGYGLTSSYYKNGLNQFFGKRFSKVIFPYILVTSILVFIEYVFLNKRYNSVVLIFTIIGINPRSPIDPTMWFVTYILICYICFYFIFKYLEHNKSKIIALLIFSLFSYYILSRIFTQDIGIIYYSIWFSLGSIYVLLNTKDGVKINNKYIKFILIPVCLVFFIVTLDSWNICYKQVNCLSCLIIALVISKFITKLNTKYIEFIGRISYELYLLESIFMRQYKFLFNLINNDLVAFIVYLILITILSIIIQKIMYKINNIKKVILG